MYYCYIIYNEHGHTYNGYTVNLNRRLRQHNGLLKGGAKATRGRGPWKFLLVLTSECWDCVSIAMKHEWSIRYPTRKRPRPKEFNGVLGRLTSFSYIFNHIRKSNMCADMTCYVKDEYMEMMREISESYEFIKIVDLEEKNIEIYNNNNNNNDIREEDSTNVT